MKNVSPSIITLNETALNYKKKPKLNNYISFQRNRSEKSMGGVCTLARSEYKDTFMKVTEGDNSDEFLITRHSNFTTPLNIINIYGEQESRCSKEEVEDRWGRILAEICKIERRKELILILGDMNKHIGNDDLGVSGNHSKISSGGELLRGFLSSGKYICLNNSPKTTGGPFTRYDPSKPLEEESMSCLDLVIVSKALEPFIESLVIDSEMKYSPMPPVSKTKSVYSDHFRL